jgi:hypothetical protein
MEIRTFRYCSYLLISRNKRLLLIAFWRNFAGCQAAVNWHQGEGTRVGERRHVLDDGDRVLDLDGLNIPGKGFEDGAASR